MSVLLSLGSVNADIQVRVPHPPTGGGTMLGADLLRTSGGKAANVAVLARRLGTDARLLACVGDDDLADQARRGPLDEGVDVAGVRRAPGATGLSTILVPPGGDKTIVLVPGANDRWAGEADAVAGEVAAAPAGSVLVVDAEIPPEVVVAAARAAREAGHTVVLDPAPADRVGDELLALVDHVVPDHREAAALTGVDAGTEAGACRAAEALLRRGPLAASVKLASGGCALARATGTTVVAAPDDLDVVDATGAGDAFAGALGWALLRRHAEGEAVALAVAASAVAVSGYGSQESYPDADELAAMRRRVGASG